MPRGTPGPHDVVVHVADSATLHGDGEKVSDSGAAGGARLHNPDRGRAKGTTPLEPKLNRSVRTCRASEDSVRTIKAIKPAAEIVEEMMADARARLSAEVEGRD